MAYHILKDGTYTKKISAKSMASIYSQFNTYVKVRGAQYRESDTAVGGGAVDCSRLSVL